jgi:hypothetical protein
MFSFCNMQKQCRCSRHPEALCKEVSKIRNRFGRFIHLFSVDDLELTTMCPYELVSYLFIIKGNINWHTRSMSSGK